MTVGWKRPTPRVRLTAGDGGAGLLGDGSAGSVGGVKSHLTSCANRTISKRISFVNLHHDADERLYAGGFRKIWQKAVCADCGPGGKAQIASTVVKLRHGHTHEGMV